MLRMTQPTDLLHWSGARRGELVAPTASQIRSHLGCLAQSAERDSHVRVMHEQSSHTRRVELLVAVSSRDAHRERQTELRGRGTCFDRRRPPRRTAGSGGRPQRRLEGRPARAGRRARATLPNLLFAEALAVCDTVFSTPGGQRLLGRGPAQLRMTPGRDELRGWRTPF